MCLYYVIFFLSLLQKKCEDYYPALSGTITYGDIKVTTTKETILTEYGIRNFKIEQVSLSMSISITSVSFMHLFLHLHEFKKKKMSVVILLR